MDSLFAQIQETIFQANFLRRIIFDSYLERQNLSLGINLQRADLNFNIPCRHMLIYTLTSNNFAGESDHRFGAQSLNFFKQIGIAVDHALSNSVMISQINKAQITQIAFTMNPTGKFHFFADILCPQFSAGMRPIALHIQPLKK